MKNTFHNHKEQIMAFSWCLLVGFIYITICSRSSFLYPFNNWDDANSYLSMAKALQNGDVIYRDIFDQKGPYLYFMYMIANLISSQTFLGVYIIEVINCSLSLFGMYRILRLYLSSKMSAAFVPLMGAVIYSSVSFYWGGSAEEMMLPFLVFAVFISVRYFKDIYPLKMPNKEVFLVGLLAGYVTLHKYTSLGLFFAFMMLVALTRLFQKEIKVAFLQSGLFLCGMFLPSIPWIIYFAYHRAFDAWYEVYIYYNIFYYSNFSDDISLWDRIYKLAKIMYWLILEHWQYFTFIVIGLIGLLCRMKTKFVEKLNLLCLFGFLFLGIFIGGVELKYYSMPLVIFVPFGFIVLGMIINKLASLLPNLRNTKVWNNAQTHASIWVCTLLACSLLVGSFFAYYRSLNTYLIGYDEDFYLFEFRDLVSETENPTLLNIGCLDAGFYTVCDVVPNCRFFQSSTVNYEYVKSEQQRYIEEGLVDYVLARDTFPSYLDECCVMVKEITNDFPDNQFTYRLYRKKGIGN